MDEIDNNRIIAEFMRGKPSPPNWSWDYHKNWNSLMPVLCKILCDEEGMMYFSAPNYVPSVNKYHISILSDTDIAIKKAGDNLFDIIYEGVLVYLKNKKISG